MVGYFSPKRLRCHDPRVLPRREVRLVMPAAREEVPVVHPLQTFITTPSAGRVDREADVRTGLLHVGAHRSRDGAELLWNTPVEPLIGNYSPLCGNRRPLLYLGEINNSQELAWRKSIAILEEGALQPRTLSLFPEDRCEGLLPDASIVRLR